MNRVATDDAWAMRVQYAGEQRSRFPLSSSISERVDEPTGFRPAAESSGIVGWKSPSIPELHKKKSRYPARGQSKGYCRRPETELYAPRDKAASPEN